MTVQQTVALAQNEGLTLMLHEFLYLLSNASDRVAQIKDNHRVEHKSQKQVIHLWELQEGQEEKVTFIHLLSKTAFKNKAPHHLVIESLKKLA